MADKDFFLSPDDSMTMGDIDYMRKTKRTRRTFPKTVGNKGGFAIEHEVSATEDRSDSTPTFQPQPAPVSQPESTASGTTSEPAAQQAPTQRRQADTSMDMFRNMAKKMRR